jgi:hypothetical protein
MDPVVEGIEFVNDLVTGFLFEMIHTGNVEKEIERQFVPTELADFMDGPGFDGECEFFTELAATSDRTAEAGNQ